MARLVIYSSGVVNRTVELTGQNIRIGRAKGNDIVLWDPAQVVSRFHAELRYEDGCYILLDLNSANGTWVWDHRIQRIVFDTGAVAEIGDYRLVLEADAEATTAPPSLRLGLDSRHLSPQKAVGGTLVISAMPPAPEPAAPEPAPPTRIPSPRVRPPAGVPPAPVAPVARSAFVRPEAPVSAPVPAAPRIGGHGAGRPEAGEAGGTSLSARLAQLPRALVVSAIALVILVVGVIGMFVGGELLLSPSDSKTKAVEQLRASPNAAPAGPTAALETPTAAPSAPPIAPAIPPATPPVSSGPGAARTPAAAPRGTPLPVGRAVPVGASPRPAERPEEPVIPATPVPVGARPDSRSVTAGLTRRAGESPADFQARAERLQGAYDEALAALRAKDFAAAVTLFERLEKDQPGLPDVPARLAESREGLRDSRRAAAQVSLTSAAGAEKRGDFVEAQKDYQRALDADPASGADEALRRVRAQMKTLGDAAFKRARTFDAMSRSEDAIAQYERALQLLPPDDPNRKVAKERLDILRAPFIK